MVCPLRYVDEEPPGEGGGGAHGGASPSAAAAAAADAAGGGGLGGGGLGGGVEVLLLDVPRWAETVRCAANAQELGACVAALESAIPGSWVSHW